MILLTAAILALVQDSPDLRWKADEERRFTCAWKMSQKAGKPEEPATNVEMVQEHTAKTTLVKTEKGIELRLQLTRSFVSGTVQGKAIEVLYEDGELKKSPDGADPELKKKIESLGTLIIAPTGRHDLPPDHYMRKFFQASGLPMGPHLPAKAVAVGIEWEGFIEGENRLRPPTKVQFKLSALEGGLAKIQMRHAKVRELTGTFMDEKVENDSDFDAAGGYCTRSVTRIKVNATREGKPLFASEGTMEFTMTPEKK